MKKLIEAFDDYTFGFDMNNELVRSRYHHSYRVMELSKKIAKAMNLSKEDIKLAEIIGLLHDFGRFEQIKNFNTIIDSKSVDHADYSVEYLFENNYIKNFKIDEELYPIIRKAIQYHNKYKLPNRGLSKRERMHMKLIRDTDKIDILYLIGVLKECGVELNNEPISEEVSSYFYQKKSVPYSCIVSSSDQVIAWLAYIYGINYKESFEYLNSLPCLEIFYENLGSPEYLRPYFDYIIKFIESKVK